MLATENTQTLAEFKENASATLERLRKTGEPEFLVADGETQAVMLSPAAFKAMWQIVDDEKAYRSMQQAIKESREGKGEDVDVVFDRLRARLLAMQAAHAAGTAR